MRRCAPRPTRPLGPTTAAARLARAAAACALLAAVAGCAPDAWKNTQATGFNGWLNTIASSCQPLTIGSVDVGRSIQENAMAAGDDKYSYFLDVSSRFYAGEISRDAYRQSLESFLGPGTSNDAAFDCIFRSLPGR
jgi:hypothetical protein